MGKKVEMLREKNKAVSPEKQSSRYVIAKQVVMLDCVTKRIYVKWYACFCVVRNEHNRKKRIEDIALLVTLTVYFHVSEKEDA